MPITLHVVKIRQCSQCGELLPQKCERCLNHPERKPKVIELYDLPEPIRGAECGCCFMFKCQRPGCVKTFWRSVKNNMVKGKSRSATMVCGMECRAIISNAPRKSAVKLPCGWCSKMIERQPAQIPTNRVVFCNGAHWQLYRKKQYLSAKVAMSRDEERLALVHCPDCKDVVEAQEISTPSNGYSIGYECLGRGHKFKIGRSATQLPRAEVPA